MKKIIAIYIKERFPLKENLPFALLIFLCLAFTLQLLQPEQQIRITLTTVGLFVAMLCIMLLMRLFDDLKDVDADKMLFPERPVPRGLVSARQLWIMVFVTHIILIAINLLIPSASLWFLICLGYTWLTFKWFFAKEFISNRLIAAFITHQPVGFLVNIWVAAALLSDTSTEICDVRMIFICFLFITPVMLWEISRKIKAKGKENEYVTYSKILGPGVAACLLLLIAFMLSAGLIWSGKTIGLTILHTILQLVALFVYSFFVVRFMVNPDRKNLILKKASVLLALFALMIFLVFILMSFPIDFAWQ